MAKEPMLEKLGEISIPIYKLEPGAMIPEPKNWAEAKITVCDGEDMPLIHIPYSHDAIYDIEHPAGTVAMLALKDGSCAATSEVVQTELEMAVSQVLKGADVDDLVKLKEAKLI